MSWPSLLQSSRPERVLAAERGTGETALVKAVVNEMKPALLIGFREADIRRIALAVERALDIKFVLHDSLWRGGDYYRCEDSEGSFILQRNNDGGPPGESAEIEFPDSPVLLYVETNHSQSEIIRHLTDSSLRFAILRR
jgi:hypothetical protein